jgi:hypothetical protein
MLHHTSTFNVNIDLLTEHIEESIRKAVENIDPQDIVGLELSTEDVSDEPSYFTPCVVNLKKVIAARATYHKDVADTGEFTELYLDGGSSITITTDYTDFVEEWTKIV